MYHILPQSLHCHDAHAQRRDPPAPAARRRSQLRCAARCSSRGKCLSRSAAVLPQGDSEATLRDVSVCCAAHAATQPGNVATQHGNAATQPGNVATQHGMLRHSLAFAMLTAAGVRCSAEVGMEHAEAA